MELIETAERRIFIELLRRHGLPESDFVLECADTTDPKGDEIEGQRGFAVVMRRSTGFRREYPIGFDPGWLARWRRDLEDGVFAGPPSGG
ncbi:hypothetical protein BKK79_23455 [Cupriavidus sp. USMAA2-4]|uniref:Uncharacterized protein n=1 Tax=Cupriavidus malaysiensis TaxID=367825 RepID=A0ABN4TVP4_9BURK|nr:MULTISPECIES: hypothetical protein [Cupriavidus]AOY97027.1 hypothetical protein BKK79_23455 [Cupriavidus sp. USMAA2-4]AOZ11009.1 hypothetical protein BKK80_32490 [Cupriavidus malaysiensis]